MKSGMNRDTLMLLRELKYPLFVLILGYFISVGCTYIQGVPFIRGTFIDDILMAVFGEGDQLFLVIYTFFIISVLDILYEHKPKEFKLSKKELAIIGLIFLVIILVSYRYMFSSRHNLTSIELISKTMFYALLGWFLKMFK